MAIIKVDSEFFRALSFYLEKLSDNRVTQAKVLRAKIDSLEINEKVRSCVDVQGLLGEAKAYLNARDELNKLVNELEEKFTVEEESLE